MEIHTLEAGLSVLENDEQLLVETSLASRRSALDHIAYAEEVVRLNSHRYNTGPLAERLAALKARFTAIDRALFARWRDDIRNQRHTPRSLRFEMERYSQYALEKSRGLYIGPDGLDMLLDGILDLHDEYIGRAAPHPEMVHYEPAPARVVLDLLDNVELTDDGLLYDLGSGLGRIAILLNLLTGQPSKGVEIDPILAGFARGRAADLNLSAVSFVTADAREADNSDGGLFFMFTPFVGSVLQAVLDKLKQVSAARPIYVCSYGTSNRVVAEQPWLKQVSGDVESNFSLTVFRSRSTWN